MADLSYLKNLKKPIAIFGLGITGSAVAQKCKKYNIEVHLWDDKPETRDKHSKNGFQIIDFKNDLSGYAMIIPAAGIKPTHPTLEKAVAQNIPIKSDIDLLYQSAPNATYIGITGTNGKSTTTALISYILKTVGKEHAMGGNIGIGAASLPSFGIDGTYVLELSSYQLAITQDAIFNIAICLNITPDHLAWHDTMKNYSAAKEKIFRAKDKKQISIIGIDNVETQSISHKLKGSDQHNVIEISTQSKLPDGLDKIETLKGQHNQQNISAAYAVCKNLNISDDDFVRATQTFPGLIHRQQIVDTINGVTFVNDSKATNAQATSKALSSFENIHWIVGGADKADGLAGLENFYSKIKHAYLIGVSSNRFTKDLQEKLSYSRCDSLDNAILEISQNTKPNDVVLLSPACVSFDQYPNFEKRGEHFIALVEQLKKKTTS